ncbi:MAG: arginine repressor [Pyrinomonadaceae bacterium]
MQKDQRQREIVNIVSAKRIKSQAALVRQLRGRGFDVTQASVSRDLDELGVIKAGGYYTIPRSPKGAEVFGLSSLETAGPNIIVARCSPGLASAAAVRIDAAGIDEIAGTIAGDDTIFIAVRDEQAQRSAIKKVWESFNE